MQSTESLSKFAACGRKRNVEGRGKAFMGFIQPGYTESRKYISKHKQNARAK